ncbi:hypothetical protein HBI81_083500 [Parastagonospora nodorum]|nr:hypothetical protein HBI10_130460 [Parastagonospora nodorum]KAH4030120.1 hypothetical protein HBI13_037120 [Parastagonospora nodorum]KAH4076539.1 hypothetical protein HBH50_007050 [Parastagonospora nodorum]KAH4095980.1 hypothetical protein HBH48_050740 [Parastagonospora nodorum]KAH4120474.1 hypothetical protein HBH47_111610 [Parastagonospora nodorum]
MHRANLPLRSGVAFYKDILNRAEERKVDEGPKQPGCLKAESGRYPHHLEEHARRTEGKDVNLELHWQEAEMRKRGNWVACA